VDQNIALEQRLCADPDELRRALEQFVRLNVDVIVAAGTQAALAAKRATDTIPIVSSAMADPVGGCISFFLISESRRCASTLGNC
jgi:ABC-type uncharacterized transport system substrate-binding protein